MKCTEVRRELPGYLDDEVASALRRALADHLRGCASCAEEAVRLDAVTRELREGLAAWAGAADAVPAVPWRRSLKARSDRRWALKLAAGLVAATFFLATFVYWPATVLSASRLPLLGPWVERLVLQDAGLRWAYQEGLIFPASVDVTAEGVTLRILGVATSPMETTVFYLLEGVVPVGSSPRGSILAGLYREAPSGGNSTEPADRTGWIPALRAEEAFSWLERPAITPLGLVGMLRVFPDHGDVLTLILESPRLKAPLRCEIPVDREAMSAVVEEWPLQATATGQGITVTGLRALRTPAELIVEFAVTGANCLTGEVPQTMSIYLETPAGPVLPGKQHGTADEAGLRLRAAFVCPAESPLTLVIPVLTRRETIEVSFPLGAEGPIAVRGIPVRLQRWEVREGRAGVLFAWDDRSRLWLLEDWSLVTAEGRTVPLESTAVVTWQGPDYEQGLEFDLPPAQVPAGLLARTAVVPVWGYWRIAIR